MALNYFPIYHRSDLPSGRSLVRWVWDEPWFVIRDWDSWPVLTLSDVAFCYQRKGITKSYEAIGSPWTHGTNLGLTLHLHNNLNTFISWREILVIRYACILLESKNVFEFESYIPYPIESHKVFSIICWLDIKPRIHSSVELQTMPSLDSFKSSLN